MNRTKSNLFIITLTGGLLIAIITSKYYVCIKAENSNKPQIQLTEDRPNEQIQGLINATNFQYKSNY